MIYVGSFDEKSPFVDIPQFFLFDEALNNVKLCSALSELNQDINNVKLEPTACMFNCQDSLVDPLFWCYRPDRTEKKPT